VHHTDAEHPKPVFGATRKVDRAGLFEVLGWAGHLGNVEPVVDDLGEHFVVEDEIVVVGIEVDVLQDFAAESAVAGVVLAQSIAAKEVLPGRQDTVGDVFGEV